MAVNIFDKYGIKEVANVYFEALEDDAEAGVYAGDIVLFLDTLKVSTIETTAENTAAQGGWGNPRLVQWDYGKEINITLTDALMSLESLRFMMGGAIKQPGGEHNTKVVVRHTAEVEAETDGLIPLPVDRFSNTKMTPKATYGHPIKVINLTKGVRTQIVVENEGGAAKSFGTNGATITFVNAASPLGSEDMQVSKGDRIRLFWEDVLDGSSNDGTQTAVEITISPSTFPGTYRVVGDTFMRNENGKDEPFQFVINRAKVASNVTLTLEAEGDPTTFEMTLNVLRSVSGGEQEMMKLVRYNFSGTTTSGTGDDKGSLTANGGSSGGNGG